VGATCAACLLPITAGDGFVLARTEVFHKQCAAAGGIARSHATKLRQELLLGKQDRERLREENRELMRRHEATIADLRRQLTYAREERENAIATKDLNVELVGRLHREKTQLEGELLNTRRALATTEGQLSRALASRDLDVAARVITGTASTFAQTQPPDPAPPPTEEKRDDAEVRFSLLELDTTK
jgi:hypothetical protein